MFVGFIIFITSIVLIIIGSKKYRENDSQKKYPDELVIGAIVLPFGFGLIASSLIQD